jgi:hypothetical protein
MKHFTPNQMDCKKPTSRPLASSWLGLLTFLLTTALIFNSSFGGGGAFAQLNVGTAGTPSVVNAYYPVSAITGNVVTVGTGTGIAHTLAVNDRVLLVQMAGKTDQNGGKFEYRKVTAVSGTSITLDGITRAYTMTFHFTKKYNWYGCLMTLLALQ